MPTFAAPAMPTHPHHSRRPAANFAILALSLGAICGCGGPTPKPIQKTPTIIRDVAAPLRGTVGSEVTLRGVEPVLVSGLGFVVGLKGTGGKPLPDAVAATMEREMGLRKISRATDAPGTAIDGVSPRELLRDPNTAVVLVQAAIPPGSPDGARFDVYVEAINADSLEGGKLWSTELRLGEATTFGQMQTRGIAEAAGPIFVNPFTEPGLEREGPSAKRGRVLTGGIVTNPLRMEMVLDDDSHSRAAQIVSAINSRLPMGAGDAGPTAMGKQGGQAAGPSITLRVPARYRENAGEFLQLVRHLPIDQSFPEERSRAWVDAVKNEPDLAEDLAWCLESVGEKAIPFLRELYEHPDPRCRMAGLRAGARLGDARAAGHLKDLAEKGVGPDRTEAISLLAKIEGGPTVDRTLQQLLGERELLIRIAAYEALAKRAEREQVRRAMRYRAANPDSELAGYSPAHVEAMAAAWLPPGMMQGVERSMVGGKFFLDIVPVGEPLIYVTQQGQPRIVLFGRDQRLRRPLTVAAWSDRLLLTADDAGAPIRLFYRPNTSARSITQNLPDDELRTLVELMAKESLAGDPRPGLALTYSEVVGALNILSESGATAAAFATERDRLKAQILDAAQSRMVKERPETPTDPEDIVMIRQPKSIDAAEKPKPVEDGPKIVPIPPKPKK